MMALGAHVAQTQNALSRQLPLDGKEILLRIRIRIGWYRGGHARLGVVNSVELHTWIRMVHRRVQWRKRNRIWGFSLGTIGQVVGCRKQSIVECRAAEPVRRLRLVNANGISTPELPY